MAEANLIKEGFLCPICHKDLRSPNNLIAHFQDLHSEEQDILKSIKDLYGKAKKKILKLDEQDLELFKNEITLEKYYLEISEPQDPGQTRSHTDYFKAVRRERLDHRTTETNKLIIRLDRLLRFYGSDRRQQEQELVAWLDGSTVTRCPSCASSFNITRRQHHCRLCGSIMCNSCSYFLAYEAAQTIVAPVHNVDVNNREQVPGKESDSLRICNHCLDMLESRRRVQMEQMRQDTQALRSGIAKKAELIDTLSKKIASLPVEDDTPKVATLQNSIRRATSHYIKEYLLTLPAPPSMQELEQIKKQRSMRNTEEESRVAVRPHIKKVIVTTGWSPSTVNNDSSEAEDPLIEQMNIVRNYIEQARKAQRFEEVESLQENLKMLKETYRQQQILKDS
ncbi:unnamed protein product [Tenebrio molitor]|nr:unnamed protein product [Tenebrio molitor]